MKKSMPLSDIIAIANGAYPDSRVEQNYNPITNRVVAKNMGGTLAKFIVAELCDTYDSNAPRRDQIKEATRALEGAIRELEAVRDAFLTSK